MEGKTWRQRQTEKKLSPRLVNHIPPSAVCQDWTAYLLHNSTEISLGKCHSLCLVIWGSWMLPRDMKKTWTKSWFSNITTECLDGWFQYVPFASLLPCLVVCTAMTLFWLTVSVNVFDMFWLREPSESSCQLSEVMKTKLYCSMGSIMWYILTAHTVIQVKQMLLLKDTFTFFFKLS